MPARISKRHTSGHSSIACCAVCSRASCPIRNVSAWRCSAPGWRSRCAFCSAGASGRCSTWRRPRSPARSPADGPQVIPAEGPRRKRVALLAGCAQPVLKPGINEATIRLLTRHGVEVVIAQGAGCCGALPHHMGKKRAGPRPRPRQHRGLDPRDRGRGTRRHRHHRLGLRHDRSRITASCSARTRLGRRKPRASRHWRATSASSWQNSALPR